jgi:hypothetical protein
LVLNGDGADDYLAELSSATGYALKRCTAVDKKAGCGKVGQVIIDASQKRKTGKGISDKLAEKLKQTIELKDKKGNNLTVNINTIKDKGGEGIIFDDFKTRTVDVGDLQKAKQAEGGATFVAGQLGHVLEEYVQAELKIASDPSATLVDAFGNTVTHDPALGFESQVVSELENDTFEPRGGGRQSGGDFALYVYRGKKNMVNYEVGFGRNQQGRVVFNVVTVKRTVIPQQ